VAPRDFENLCTSALVASPFLGP